MHMNVSFSIQRQSFSFECHRLTNRQHTKNKKKKFLVSICSQVSFIHIDNTRQRTTLPEKKGQWNLNSNITRETYVEFISRNKLKEIFRE